MNTFAERIERGLTRLLIGWLTGDTALPDDTPASRPGLEALLEPGDVILVAGRTRFSRLISHLTRSSWTHVAIFVGPGHHHDPACTLIEADIAAGVRFTTLADLADCRIQVVRASRLPASSSDGLTRHLLEQLGRPYDLPHVIQLARLLLFAPLPVVRWLAPRTVRRADPSRAICSTLVARALFAAGVRVGASPLLAPRLRGPGQPAQTDAAAVLDYLVPGDFAELPEFVPVFDSRQG